MKRNEVLILGTDCLLIGCIVPLGNEEAFKELVGGKTTDSFFYPQILYETLNYVTYLENCDRNPDYIVSFEKEKDLLDEKLAKGVKVVGIFTQFLSRIDDYIKVIRHIKTGYPDIKIAVGGSFIKNLIKKLSGRERRIILGKIDADVYIYRYECQVEFGKYVRYVRDGGEGLSEIPNILWLENGELHTSTMGLIGGYEDSHAICWDKYQNRVGGIAALRSTINCDFECAFCAIKDDSEAFRKIGIGSIKDNLDGLARLKQVKTIFYSDETVNYPKDRFIDLLNMQIQGDYPFNWYGFLRCQYIDPEIASLLEKSKCIGAILGLESGDAPMLERMNKKVNIEEYREGHRLLKKHGIFTFALFVVGFPGEDEFTMKETMDFINDLKPDFYILNPWTCEEGTTIYEQRSKYGLSMKNGKWRHDTMGSQMADDAVMRMRKKIHGSIDACDIDLSYIIQLLDDGYALDQIRGFIDGYRQKANVGIK